MSIVETSSGIPSINGLSYFPEFVSRRTAFGLMEAIDSNTWSDELKRRVQHYGFRYDYKARIVSRDSYLGPLPNWIDSFIEENLPRSILPERPDQVIVNEYIPGQGISAHIDCIPCFGGTIASLSLASSAYMEFFGSSGERESLYLKPRSLLVLQGDARSRWRHAIPARKSDLVDGMRIPRTRRVSMTFRKVLSEKNGARGRI